MNDAAMTSERRENIDMKIAITVWNDRISPLCDSARSLLLVDIQDGRVVQRRYARFPDESAFHQAEALQESGVNLLICGAITSSLANLIESSGIRIQPFVTGKVTQVLNAFLTGHLSSDQFRMPGSNRKRRAGFQRQRRRHYL